MKGSDQATTDGTVTLPAPEEPLADKGVGICPTCGSRGSGVQSFVFALGSVDPRFPTSSVEKEYAQVVGRADSGGLANRELLYATLAKPENRYLPRQLCWVLKIEGLDTYLLQPRDVNDFDKLVDAIRPPQNASLTDIDVVIGQRGPIASPEMCNGLQVPIVIFDTLDSLDRTRLVQRIKKPAKVAASEFTAGREQLLLRIAQMADNAGDTDEYRALNYCAVRQPEMYENDNRLLGEDFSLSAVEARPSRLSSRRKIVDVVLSYSHRKTDFTEKYYWRVDVTEEFPFLVSGIAPYYDR
jgi:PatG C-terminal